MKKHHAFTLIELMVSVAVLLAVMVIAIPHLRFFQDYTLYREQDLLCATLTYVQHKAIARNKSQEMIFDIKKNNYSYHYPGNKQQTYVLQNGVTFGFLPGANGPPGKPEKLISKPITFNNQEEIPKIICMPDGTSSAGTIYLLDKAKNKMVALAIGVGESMMIRKYEYENSQWVLR